jgi:hypothetical protein
MAENEILDIKGNRWRETRRLIALPNSSCSDIAERAVSDLDAGIGRDLIACLRRGQSLVELIRVATGSPDALREVIQSFTNRGLARIVGRAIQDCGPPPNATRIAEQAALILTEKAFDKVRAFAAEQPEFEDANRRRHLQDELAARLDNARNFVAERLEQALEGERIRGASLSRKSRPSASEQMRNVLERSILVPRQIRGSR